MVPNAVTAGAVSGSAPRARGDGPGRQVEHLVEPDCSPRPRGWSLLEVTSRHSRRLLPAPAGMVPPPACHAHAVRTAPRARGDGPPDPSRTAAPYACSPRPRGWSSGDADADLYVSLLPAPAGMVPTCGPAGTWRGAAPRARGDGPELARGDLKSGRCSPRPRGWSQAGGRRLAKAGLLPAPAGMVPEADERVTAWVPCSPRPRGWSRLPLLRTAREGLLPAPAGMVPRRPR